MTRRVRSALGRFLALSCTSALTLLVVASPLAAQQTTGKIQGTVTDDKGAAIASAQVTIVGTSFGALTDSKGYYFINNVLVGSYTMRARFIGFTPAEVQNLRVLGGFTITQDFKLTPSAVAIGPVTVEAAANPIVPRDQVSSQSVLPPVSSLPVNDVRQVVALQPGVVESGAGGGLVIRGGRPGEANVYIDGAPVRSNILGSQSIQVNRNAIEEAAVTTGALGVQFGDAQSGVITYTTKAGGQKLQGSGLYSTDEPFGASTSLGFNRFEGSLGGPVPSISNLSWFLSGTLQGQLSANSASQVGADFNTGAAQNQGIGWDTVPTFVLGGIDTIVNVAQSDGSVKPVAIPRFVQFGGECGHLGNPNAVIAGTTTPNQAAREIGGNYGFDCQGQRLPLSWNTTLQLQGKLAYSYGSGSSLSLTAVSNGSQFRDFPRRNIVDPLLYRGTHAWSRLGVLNWNHTVFKAAEHQLSLSVNVSYGTDREINGPLDPSYEVATRSPLGGFEFSTMRFAGFGDFPFPVTDQIVRNIRTNTVCADATSTTGGSCKVPLLNRQDLRNSQDGRIDPYGFLRGGWVTEGFDAGGTLRYENRGRIYGQVDWQANRYHRFNFGGEWNKSKLAYWSSSFTTQIFMDAYVAHPWLWSLWGADRLDLGDVVLQFGLRYDRMNYDALFSNTPGRTYAFKVCYNFAASCPSADSVPVFSPSAATDAAAYDSGLARAFTPSVPHGTLSPRLGVAFPITDRTSFRLSYSHQVNKPDFNTVLSGTNNDLSFTNTNDAFGRDITFGKTIMFEFAVRHAFNPDLVLDVSAYNKDFVSEPAYRIRAFNDPAFPGKTVNVNILTNADFGYARGVDVKLDRRVGNWLNASLAYTLQIARGTGSDPTAYLRTSARQVQAVTGDRVPPPEQALPTDDNRLHNLVGTAALTVPADWRKGTALGAILHDIGVYATFRAVSGLPYTRIKNSGGGNDPTNPPLAPRTGLGLESNAEESLNSSTMPWTKFLDVRVNKGFKIGVTDWQLFVDARNVLNFRNVARLFAETGAVVNARNRTTFLDAEFLDLRSEARTAGAFQADSSIDLTGSCGTWASPVNCVMLRRTEARWGDGDGILTLPEQQRAFNAEYNLLLGVQTMYGAPRNIRLGVELNF